MNQKIILKNKKEIIIEASSSINDIRTISDSKQAMISLWDEFNDENLSNVEIYNSDGMLIGVYSDLIFVSETSTIIENEKILTSFYFHEKTSIEKRLEMLETSQTIQDGAIIDAAYAISNLAEGR